MSLPDRGKFEDQPVSGGSREVEIERMCGAKTMRKQSFAAYGNSFSEPSLFDPKTAPKLSLMQRLYLRAYDKLYQIFMHSYSVLSEIKERREREGIGFQFALPDPEVVKGEFRRKMRSIIGEGNYDGYERALRYEQNEHGLKANEGLIIGNEEVD